MLTGKAVIDHKLVSADASGAVTFETVPDGWNYYGGEWYYYINGRPYTGWIGEYYIDDGCMLRNSITNLVHFEGDDDRIGFSSYVDMNGLRLRNCWVNDGQSYVKADGSLACNESVEINGKRYDFDNSGNKIVWADKFGIYLEDGAYISAKNYQQGWSYIDGGWYYKEKNNFIYNQTKKIGRDWYCFDIHGKMVIGFSKPQTIIYSEYSMTEYTYDNAKFYYGADGRRIYYTGWQVIDGNWYYFNANSEAADGWHMIGGVKYYFGKTDHFMYTGYKVIDGDLYYFDASGASQGISESVTGWHQQGGDWYYIRNGHVVTGKRVIDGTLYKFNDNGVWIS